MAGNNREWGSTEASSKKSGPKLKHAYEMLDEIESAKPEDKVALIKQYGATSPLNFLLSLNFNSKVKLDLPEGMPPLDPKEMDTSTHPDLMGFLSASIQRLKYCTVESKIKHFKKEEIFVQTMLTCPMKDAEILCSCKDKALHELYPSITRDLVKSVFPAYVK